MALGAVAGGLTLALGGATAGLLANLVSYGLAVLLYVRIRVAVEPGDKATRSRGGLAEGFRYIVGQRTLAAIVGGFAAVTLAAGLVAGSVRLADDCLEGPSHSEAPVELQLPLQLREPE